MNDENIGFTRERGIARPTRSRCRSIWSAT